MKLTFVGHGYVGLVTAAIFADFGNEVYVIGRSKEKIDNLNRGIIPIFEPGLEEIVKRGLKKGYLSFGLSYEKYVAESDIVFTAVGTPSSKTGEADLSMVLDVAEKIGKNLSGYTVIATKSTVPVGTNKKIREIIETVKSPKAEFDMASVPEFLREGTAISDTLHPDRIVIGSESMRAQKLLLDLHKPIDGQHVLCNLETAEMIKYASNSFLATKISFANAIAHLSETVGADGLEVLRGIGLDRRIGKQFLQPGPGYGGSCFPKDVRALISIAKGFGYDFQLLRDVEKINEDARRNIVKKAQRLTGGLKGKTVGILGLAFKANTDDMRDAPAIDIIHELKKQGAQIKAYDPQSMETAKRVIDGIDYQESVSDAVANTDCVIVLTDWNEFKELDLSKLKKLMKKSILIDARNLYDPQELKTLGFTSTGVGR